MLTSSPLERRYPQLAFLLRSIEPKQPSYQSLPLGLDLDGIEILFVYGMGDRTLYEELKRWLHAQAERDLVFIDDELSRVAAVMEESWIEDPQVHIRFLMEGASVKSLAQEIGSEFPIHKMKMVKREGKSEARFRRLSLALKRSVTLNHALFNEGFYYHELFKNLLPNFHRIEGAAYVHRFKGAFRGVPAIICGAGPSLDQLIPFLKEMEERALIIAGGSTITALTQRGVQPHIGIAIDPNPEEYERLASHKAVGMPLIFASRVNREIFSRFDVPLGYLRSFTGGAIEQWLEEQLGFDDDPLEETINPEALSVTTTCIGLAQFLGCNPIYLAGIDLAYTQMKRYASGVMEASQVILRELKREKRVAEGYLRRKGQNGQMVHTLVKWVMEANWISSFAKKHPQTRYFNLSSEGLGFHGIDLISPPELTSTGNLREKVLNLFEMHALKGLDIARPLSILEESFKQCEQMIGAMIKEPHLAFVHSLDMEEEIAYQLALEPYRHRLHFALKRRLRSATDQEIEREALPYLQAVVREYRATFENNRSH